MTSVLIAFALIFNFFINKNSQGRKLSVKRIPSSSNSALVRDDFSLNWSSKVGNRCYKITVLMYAVLQIINDARFSFRLVMK